MEQQGKEEFPKKNPAEESICGGKAWKTCRRDDGKRNLGLSARLAALAGMVKEGNRLVDVGCDHGYLPIYLVLCGKVPSAVAMDVRPGPLSRAKEHIRNYGLSDYIECRLSDGLAALSPGEGDTLVLAGMGGPLMERILTDGATVRDSFSELILQPQSDVPHFRHFIRSQGWEIVAEEMVLEDGKFYPMMRVERVLPDVCGNSGAGEPAENAAEGKAQGVRRNTCVPLPSWTPEEEAFGKLLLKRRDPVLREYLLREERIRKEILSRLRESAGMPAQARAAEVEGELRLIRDALSRYPAADAGGLAAMPFLERGRIKSIGIIDKERI